MMTCTAKELCAATGGTLVQDGEGFSCVSTDSRRVEQGCLFIPLVGERFDGHTYLAQALESGAAGCLCSRLPEALVPGKFYVQVEDTLRALGQLAGWYREKFPIPVVQITGSAGKTTTKEMIASVLSRHFLTLKTEANYNNEIGTPQTLLRLMPEHQAAVIETGMDHFGQIRYLGERLESFNMSIGLRPVLPGAADTIMDLYGPVLEQLSELEHERWMKDKRADGWRYGKRDSELKLHPDMRPYQELDESTKEFIRMSVRNVPDYLKEIGYELYRKSF